MLEHIKKAFEVEGLSAIEKFTLIALADYANEEGVCWPSHKALMKKTGIGNKKTLWKSLTSLENNGLLEINKAGQNEKKTANIYKLFVGDSDFSRCTFRRSKVRRSNFIDLVGTKVPPEATIEDTSIYTPSPLEGGACEFGTDEASPEPELTTLTGTFPVEERPTTVQQEPTGESDEINSLTAAENGDLRKNAFRGLLRHDNRYGICNTKTANRALEGQSEALNDALLTCSKQGEASKAVSRRKSKSKTACPFETIVALYHEKLPMLPSIVALTEKRKRLIDGRWKDIIPKRLAATGRPDTPEERLEYLGSFFDAVSESDFLTGRGRNWKANFEWLFTESHFLNVVEGNYANRD